MLDQECALTSVNYEVNDHAAAANATRRTTLESMVALAGTELSDYYRLTDGKCITQYTQPDEQHLKMMLQQLMSGDLTFPFYSWILGCNEKCSSTFSKDISYSGSRIDRTYWTFVNQGTTGDATYEIPCADYKASGGGMRSFHNMK